MTDRIVQLENKDGDNIYPIAGGVPNNTITTALLADNSITADKIDFSTLGYASKSWSSVLEIVLNGPGSGQSGMSKVKLTSLSFTLTRASTIEVTFMGYSYISSGSGTIGFYVCVDDNTNNLHEISSSKNSQYGGICPISSVSSGVHTLDLYLGASESAVAKIPALYTMSVKCQTVG